MPRTNLPIVDIPVGGGGQLTEQNADQANGMELVNPGDVFLACHNGDAASRTITVVSVAQPPLGRTGDKAVTIAAGARALIGPLRPNGFNQPDGKVNIDFSAGTTTAFKVAAVRIHY